MYNKSIFPWTIFAFFLLVVQCKTPQPTTVQIANQPNVLFLAIDDLNNWLGCLNGHPDAKTPHIDRLASRGTLFTNAHCQAPLCGPSRASLMSGLRPSSTGIYGQINDKNLAQVETLGKDITYLPQYFGRFGYKTMGVGKLFHQFAPEGVFQEAGGRAPGFGPKPKDRFHYDPKWFNKPAGTSTDWGVYPERDDQMPDYRTAQWTIERLKQEHDRPFFLAAGFLRPHVPWYVPQKWFDLYPIDSIATAPYFKNDLRDVPAISQKVHEVPMMPTTEWTIKTDQLKAVTQAYLACISFVDHYVGTILNALDSSAYADNTIVVLWSDHGYHLGEKNRFAKHSLWQEATQVPLIISGPGLPQNQTCHKPVELLDLYPTLLDLCQLPPNTRNEGESLQPLLLDPNSIWGNPAITTYGWNNHSICTDDFRYIRYEDGSEEFYDHRTDKNEWKNLAGNAQYQTTKEALKDYFPQLNSPWSNASDLKVNAYFRKQKALHMSRK